MEEIETALVELQELFPNSPVVEIRRALGKNGVTRVGIFAGYLRVGSGMPLSAAMEQARQWARMRAPGTALVRSDSEA